MITYANAVKMYMTRHKESQKVVHHLTIWDDRETLTENAGRVGLTHAGCWRFMKKYDLKCKRSALGRKAK